MTTVKTALKDYWHSKFSIEAEEKSSLKLLKYNFLPLGHGPHPILSSCGNSQSCIRAATVQIQILSGRYRTDYFYSKFLEGSTGECLLEGCGVYPGDVDHLLSGECAALRSHLDLNLERNLSELKLFHPDLFNIVQCVLNQGGSAWTSFVVVPTPHQQIIQYKQLFGADSIYPVMRLSRSYIWCMHRSRLRLKGLLIK